MVDINRGRRSIILCVNDIQLHLDNLREDIQIDFISIATTRTAFEQVRNIQWYFVSGNTNNLYKNIRLQIGRGLGGIVWRTGRTHEENDIQAKKAKLLTYPIARSEKLTYVYGIPLQKEDQVIGVLLAGNRTNRTLSIEEKQRIDNYVNQLEQLIEVWIKHASDE
ncbi:hypothetical protein HMPREF0556_10122 [Listeria grayi DSM 20601]|uniref:GAF domain-containing protein n=1 Tax=Listeria grayi DSM 20601 TaxID=525367 RepID=D7UUJ7_LISGR|nr:hypothetical protein HMPREF0556_10122 [Listeria grayi DSM 20601]